MPKYDYRCGDCGYVMEIKHPMSQTVQDLGRKCEECGSPNLEKMISIPTLILPDKDTSCTTCTSCSAASCPK